MYTGAMTSPAPLMNEAIRNVVTCLDSPEVRTGGYTAAAIREGTLIVGLNAIATDCGIELFPLSLDSRAEFSVRAVPAPQSLAAGIRGGCGEYGEAFAGWLSRVEHRMGVQPTTAPMLPENGWCFLNHFSAERLIRLYDAEVNTVEA